MGTYLIINPKYRFHGLEFAVVGPCFGLVGNLDC